MAHLKPIITLAIGAVLAVSLLSWLAHTAEASWLVLAADATDPEKADPAEQEGDAGDTEGAPGEDEPEDEYAEDDSAEEQPGPAMAGTAEGLSDTGREVVMAIAIHDGKAETYICDGAELEMWLSGDAHDGQLDLTGPDDARITGNYDEAEAVGNLTAGDSDVDFSLPWLTEADSGLYRAQETVDGGDLVIGWIVRDDGSVIGTASLDGAVQAAPELDVDTRTTVFDGTEISAGRLGTNP